MDGRERGLVGLRENISRTERCAYVVAGAGLGARFCDRPTVHGAYCARHAARCAVAPGTEEAARIIAEFDHAARLHAAEFEPLLATEPEEAMAALDAPRTRSDEP